MKVLCILLCVAFASGFYIDNNGTHDEKIVGGYPVKIEDIPYQASLLWYGTDHICGATIIHSSWVITAAHCVKNKSHISVRTGSGSRKTLGNVHTVEKIIKHADFETNGQRNNDIALIMLEEPIKFNYKQESIELAKSYDIPRVGELMRISGFGKIEPHLGKSDVLRAAYVPVLSKENCEKIYRPDFLIDKMICAGNENTEAKYGDSGGPGVIHGKLYGIISMGQNSGSTILPGVYTSVHRYYNWIVEKTGLIL